MSALLDLDALTAKAGSYLTGQATAVSDSTILQEVRQRRRQLGQLMIALDRDAAARKIPSGDYLVSRKIDGEFTCLVYREGEPVFTINPGGTVRTGAPFHEEARAALEKAGVKQALIGGELYVQRPDGKRPRVHDVTRIARAPDDEAAVATLAFAIFNLYDVDGTDLSMRYGDAVERMGELFGEGKLVHPVETIATEGSRGVLQIFEKWVDGEGAEGVVVRSDSAGTFKVKPRHTLDLAVIGFTESIDDRVGLLHDMLLAIVRPDGTFQIVSKVGGGFTEDDRARYLKELEEHVVESDFVEVNSDRVAYRMLRPGIVIEISCLDLISRTSRGSTIDKMVLEWNEADEKWAGVRRLPLCSVISPQFIRMRDDKGANPDDVRITQLSDIVDIPELNASAEDLQLPASEIIHRIAATKELRGATMVRKIVAWKTNKEEASRDYPAYVIHLTDYSPNRKTPLEHDVRVSDHREQIEEYWVAWQEKYFVKGWVIADGK